MKTAISVPDALFKRWERRAAKERTSRSALIAKALEKYLDDVDGADITARINEVMEEPEVVAEQREFAEISSREAARQILRDDPWPT